MGSTLSTKKYKWLSFAILSVFLLAISFHYHRNEINKYPSYIHAWAQADHYALALGFTENGYDFFHPQTYNLNKQFPNNFAYPYQTGVTSADFPIHAYIPALLMGLTGSTSPFWMRMYLLIYSLVGLLFLFLLTREISKNYIAPFAVVAFATLSPVFLYYQATFLPTIPSLANAIIGYYFFVKYLKDGKNRHFGLAIGFLTLGALARTPFAIFLVAIMCQEFICFIKNRKINAFKIIGFTTSFLALSGYFLYNQHLRNDNGSIFLNLLSNPNSFAHFKAILSEVTNKWGNHYFTRFQYTFFILLLVTYIIHQVFHRNVKDSLSRKFGFHVLIASFGSILYSILMAKQFLDHDYYFLDSLFLPFILLIAFISGQFAINSKTQKAIALSLFILSTSLFQVDAHKRVKNRQQAMFWDKVELVNKNFEGSDQLLNSLNISKDAVIMVFDSQSTNNAFVHMKRKGYAILSANREEIVHAIGWNYDYIAVQNCFFYPDLVNIYPEILTQFERVGGNDNISILKKTANLHNHEPFELLGIDKKTPKMSSVISFDNQPELFWSNTYSVNNPSDTSNKMGYTSPNNEWSIAFSLSDSILRSLQSIYPVFKAKFFSNDKEGNVWLMANYEVGNKSVSQQVFLIDLNAENAGKWRTCNFVLPAIRYVKGNKENHYSLFVWNSDKKEFSYDDVSISIY